MCYAQIDYSFSVKSLNVILTLSSYLIAYHPTDEAAHSKVLILCFYKWLLDIPFLQNTTVTYSMFIL